MGLVALVAYLFLFPADFDSSINAVSENMIEANDEALNLNNEWTNNTTIARSEEEQSIDLAAEKKPDTKDNLQKEISAVSKTTTSLEIINKKSANAEIRKEKNTKLNKKNTEQVTATFGLTGLYKKTGVSSLDQEILTEKNKSLHALANSAKSQAASEFVIDRPSIQNFSLLNTLIADQVDQNSTNELFGNELSLIDIQDIRKRRHQLSIAGGFGLFSKSLLAHDVMNDQYAIQREQFEKPLEQFTVQLTYTIPLVGGMSFSTGINYQQFTEHFEWSGNYLIDQNGEFIDQSAETVVEQNYYQEVSHSLENFNTSSVVSVPILIGYTFNRNRLSYGVKLGTNLTVASMRSGQTLDLNLIPDQFLPVNNQLSFGLQSQVELGYKLRAGLELFGELNYRQVTLTDDILTQQIHAYGIGLGLRNTF